MATITTIAAGDLISNSRADLNTNFTNLNSDKIETSVLDTDTTLAANSDSKVATQKATKAYVDAGGNVNASTTQKGIVEEATAAEVAARTAAGGTGARLFINPSTPITQFSTTQVFTGTSPNSTYTDLDLSAVVGAVQRMVYLKVVSSVGTGMRFAFKPKGDTSTYSATMSGANTGTLSSTAGDAVFFLVKTDTAGVVQWTAGTAQDCTITVQAYW